MSQCNNKHQHAFKVTCYKHNIGVFTVYGARVKSRKVVHPLPYPAIHNHSVPRDRRFIDTIYYDVVLYSNPELSQSVACYTSKDLCKAENYLNNFIDLCAKGYDYIDLSKVSDKEYPHPHPHPCPPCPPPHPRPCPGPFYENDTFECKKHDDEIDPRYLNDPRTNPHYDVFENLTKEDRYAKQLNHCEGYPEWYDYDIDVDFKKTPVHDGDKVRMERCDDNCQPVDCDCHHHHHHHFKPEPPCPPYDPPYKPLPDDDDCHHHHHHHHHRPEPPCPPHPCPPIPCRDKICIYYGNGGFAMGESVVGDKIEEMAKNALRTMICKNYHSTFSNMNPRDTIVVKKNVLDCILPREVFTTNMDIAGEWSFFMIPDRYHKLVEDFNWYYKEETMDGQWIELDKSVPQKAYVFQDNGVRYFINAVKLNGRYNMRFAKSGRDFNQEAERHEEETDNRELNFDMKFVISLFIEDYASKNYTVTIEDLSVTNQVVRYIDGFIDNEYAWQAIENHVYELVIKAEDGSVLATKYFVAVPDDNYNHGFCTWVSDSYDSEKSIVEQFTKVIDLEPPKTKCAIDRYVLTTAEIEG